MDFDGGGRYRCELTDSDPDAVAIGSRVRMTFRRFYTADGMHNYFWKARTVKDGPGASTPTASTAKASTASSPTASAPTKEV